MKYIERKTKKIVNIKDQKSLIFLYKTIPGRIILKIITKPVFSKITGHLINSKLSKAYIKKFIQKNNIDMTKYKKETYKNFNDFFTRNVNNPKPEKDINKNLLISPCDAKLMVYEIKENLTINVKNSTYNIETLIKEKPNKNFKNGKCLVFRLSPDDYHRYHAFDNQEIKKTKKIKGLLHTVNPISYETHKVFTENQREVSLIKTENFQEIYQIEVGALNIGKIHNTAKKNLKKYEEKGYFSFGGSTIILLFQNNAILIDEDIEKNSKKGLETKIQYQEVIGKTKKIWYNMSQKKEVITWKI